MIKYSRYHLPPVGLLGPFVIDIVAVVDVAPLTTITASLSTSIKKLSYVNDGMKVMHLLETIII